MKYSQAINISIAIILTAVAIILGRSYTGAYFLIIIAVIILAIVFGRYIFSLIPKVYFTKDAAYNAVLRIYETAAEDGGQLVATHIKPEKLSPKEDIAANKLKSVKKTLRYERFVLLDDKRLENEWINNTLMELDPKIEVSIYFIGRFQLTPLILREVLPRANILLYNKEKKYICLLGLDRLRTTDPRYELVNFAVEFHNPDVFDALYRYFQSITACRYIKRVKSFEEHKAISNKEAYEREIQSILNSLISFGAELPDVLHIGIFGQMATYLNGFQELRNVKEHEADLDLMIIVNPRKKEQMKNKLLKVLESPKLEIVWGDNRDYFYHFRSEGKITVDIEIHEKETDFYEQHPLLGRSIFAYYRTVYRRNEQYIENLLRLPYGFSVKDRFKLLRDDKKGLSEFERRLDKYSVEIDPRRVVSLCIKNIVWAMTGWRPLNVNAAFKFLSNKWTDVFPSVAPSDVKELLLKSQSEIHKNYGLYQNRAVKVISDALQYSNSRLRE